MTRKQKKKPEEFVVEHKNFLYVFTPHKSGRWEVIKGTLDGEQYIGSYFVGEEGCSCPGGKHHGHCWHQEAVSEYEMPQRDGGDANQWIKSLAFAVHRGFKDVENSYRRTLEKRFKSKNPDKTTIFKKEMKKLDGKYGERGKSLRSEMQREEAI